MTYEKLISSLSVAQRLRVLDHADTIIEHLGQAALHARHGLTIKASVLASLADERGIWPQSTCEPCEIEPTMEPELEEILDELDEQLQIEFPLLAGLTLATD